MNEPTNEIELPPDSEGASTEDGINSEIDTVFHGSMYSGPIPPPEMLRAYKEIYPESLPIIFDIFQQQSESRIHLESLTTEAQVKLAIRGQMFGFALSIIALIGSFVLIAMGKSVIGISTLLGTAISLIGLFVYDRYQSQKNAELEDSDNSRRSLPPAKR